jgi:hypothetical protein
MERNDDIRHDSGRYGLIENISDLQLKPLDFFSAIILESVTEKYFAQFRL